MRLFRWRGSPRVRPMGAIGATQSTASAQDALSQMLGRLDDLGIPICYSRPRQQYFYVEKPALRRWIVVRETGDCFGAYWECVVA